MNIHNAYISPGAKPIFKRGSGAVGCLCIHGFSAAPSEIGWLDDHLHENLGMTTYTPRLTGHGTFPEDMRHVRWHDWYMTVRDGYELLASQCDRVFVAGISMGGLLALLLAAAEDTTIDAAAVIAAPLVYNHKHVQRAHLYKWLVPMKDMPDNSGLPQIICEEQQRRGEPIVGRTHYKRWSLAAVAELNKLTQAVQQNLTTVSAALALIYTARDHSVSLQSMDYIKARVQSSSIEQHVLQECGHIITQDVERDKAFHIVEQFFSTQLNGVLE